MLLEESNVAVNNTESQEVREAKLRECLTSLVRIGVACSAESPDKRMYIKDVLKELNIGKEVLLGDEIHRRRHIRMHLTGEGTSRPGD